LNVVVRDATVATSRDSPNLLGASYVERHAAFATAAKPADRIELDITAKNTGSAIWLAQTKGEKGTVRLGWRWFRESQALDSLAGRAAMGYDIFPGQSYRFRVSLVPPTNPGVYVLETGLVSERVAWFSDLGVSPLRLVVEIRAR
jgi:hypothetical protein